jgi:hypothetical protein
MVLGMAHRGFFILEMFSGFSSLNFDDRGLVGAHPERDTGHHGVRAPQPKQQVFLTRVIVDGIIVDKFFSFSLRLNEKVEQRRVDVHEILPLLLLQRIPKGRWGYVRLPV